MSPEPSIRRVATSDLPRGMRYEHWMNLVSGSLWPVTDWTGISEDFSLDMREARFGCLTVVSETMTGAPRARRTRRDVDNSAESFYALVCLLDTSGYWTHNGHNQHLGAGDVILIGHGEHDSYMEPSGFRSNIIKLPTHWVESWLPDANLLAGRVISKHSRWGGVLSPMVSQLTPECVTAPPLPQAVLVDQLGTTLALIAGESEARTTPELLRRVQDCIRERCREPELTASEVASSLDVPPRIVHRVLAVNELTFASQLLDARIGTALQLLGSPSSAQLTAAKIARLAGFSGSAYLAHVLRKRTGHTARELRRLLR